MTLCCRVLTCKMCVFIVLWVCQVAIAVHFQHSYSLDNMKTNHGYTLFVTDILHCADKCIQSLTCQTFSFKRDQSLCGIDSRPETQNFKEGEGWTTWLRSGVQATHASGILSDIQTTTPPQPTTTTTPSPQTTPTTTTTPTPQTTTPTTPTTPQTTSPPTTTPTQTTTTPSPTTTTKPPTTSTRPLALKSHKTTSSSPTSTHKATKATVATTTSPVPNKVPKTITTISTSPTRSSLTKSTTLTTKVDSTTEAATPKRTSPLPSTPAELIGAIEDGDLATVKSIIKDHNELIHSEGLFHRTPIMMAALCGQLRIFQFLAKRNFDSKKTDIYECNLLLLACIGGNDDIVRRVLDIGDFDLDRGGFKGKTPLITGVVEGKLGIVKMLLERGANISVGGKGRNTAIHWACITGNLDIVKYLLSKNADINSKSVDGTRPIMYSIQHDREKVFSLLLKKGCNLKSIDEGGNNILHVAAFFGRVKIMVKILEMNIIGIDDVCYLKRTALMKAVYAGEVVTAQTLMRKKCKINTLDINGNTILHLACLKNIKFVVGFLMSKKIVRKMINIKNSYGLTPLQVAEKHKNMAVVSFLKSRGKRQ